MQIDIMQALNKGRDKVLLPDHRSAAVKANRGGKAPPGNDRGGNIPSGRTFTMNMFKASDDDDDEGGEGEAIGRKDDGDGEDGESEARNEVDLTAAPPGRVMGDAATDSGINRAATDPGITGARTRIIRAIRRETGR